MTLGPKYFCCSKMTVTRRRKHFFQKYQQNQFIEIFLQYQNVIKSILFFFFENLHATLDSQRIKYFA